MSRGGGRGGRGGGRGGGPGFVIPAHSTMSKQEWAEALKEAPPKNIGMLFPVSGCAVMAAEQACKESVAVLVGAAWRESSVSS